MSGQPPGHGRRHTVDVHAKQRILDLTELQASKSASRLQHPIGLFEHIRDGRAIPDAKGNGIQIVCVVWNLSLGSS